VDAEPTRCALTVTLGQPEECRGPLCPFWEEGGAVAEPACALERLGLDLLDVSLAEHLLILRRSLERARDQESARAAYDELARLTPPDLSEA
jgi:hypothetical protein